MHFTLHVIVASDFEMCPRCPLCGTLNAARIQTALFCAIMASPQRFTERRWFPATTESSLFLQYLGISDRLFLQPQIPMGSSCPRRYLLAMSLRILSLLHMFSILLRCYATDSYQALIVVV